MAILTLRIRRASVRLPLMLLLGAALAGCMSERPPLNLPNASVVTFDGVEAHGPDCTSIAIPSHVRTIRISPRNSLAPRTPPRRARTPAATA
jgi:hypothetical protein